MTQNFLDQIKDELSKTDPNQAAKGAALRAEINRLKGGAQLPAAQSEPIAPKLTPEQIDMQRRLAAFLQTEEGRKTSAQAEQLVAAELQKWEQSKQQPQAPQAGVVTAEQFQEAMQIIKRQGDELAQLKKSLGETN